MKLFARLLTAGMLPLLMAPSARAVTFDFLFVPNVGNACDPQPSGGCYGAVDHYYQIAKYEVTNDQYTVFLNAVADTDPYGLYDANMASTSIGGITGACPTPTTCSYNVIAGRGSKPVTYISFYDAMRFVNWLHNGQPTGPEGPTTTETGAYTITESASTITRNPNAKFFIPSEDEWFKAAYYNAAAIPPAYFASPAQSNSIPSCSVPTATSNSANCSNAVGNVTDVGSYPGSAGPYGTYDQGGNVWEWNEALIMPDVFTTNRGIRGGSYEGIPNFTLKGARENRSPYDPGQGNGGIRVAPEPGSELLFAAGAVTVACLKRRRTRLKRWPSSSPAS